jgi:hypothetical protein
MKKLIPIAALLLASCVNLNYDAGEYDRFVTINIAASKALSSCGTDEITPYITQMEAVAEHQKVYAEYRKARPEIAEASSSMYNMIRRFSSMYKDGTPSDIYCRLKLANINISSARMLSTLGEMK